MKVGIIGSGSVAGALEQGFTDRGHEVKLGSYSGGTMDEAAAFGELLVLACKGTETESAIEAAGRDNFSGKVVVDVTNPLVFGDGLPTLAYGPTDSGGEVVQRAIPEAKVVKTLNIVNAGQMVDPDVPEGPPTMFIAGNDEGAKEQVSGLLSDFGWEDVIDIGGIDASRELESLCVLWVRFAVPNEAYQAAFRLLR
jgi:predicted dinucleotide-binding enzyme